MTNKASSPRAKSFDGKNSYQPGTVVLQTPVETPVAREPGSGVDALPDNSRKILRFVAVDTDFKSSVQFIYFINFKDNTKISLKIK